MNENERVRLIYSLVGVCSPAYFCVLFAWFYEFLQNVFAFIYHSLSGTCQNCQ